MSVERIELVGAEPVTIAQLMYACRLSLTGDIGTDAAMNADLTLSIASARAQAEAMTLRTITPCILELKLDCYPENTDIELPKSPVIGSIEFYYVSAATGLETLLPSNQYVLDRQEYRAWLLPAGGVTWPALADVANAIRIRYTAGYPNLTITNPKVVTWIKSAAVLFINGDCSGGAEIPRDWNASLLDDLIDYSKR